MSKRDKGKTTHHTLDMRKLLSDAMKLKLEAKIPEHYSRSWRAEKNLIPASAEEKLEKELIDFFLNYLDTAIPDNVIAERYNTTKDEVITVRDTWHATLARYYV